VEELYVGCLEGLEGEEGMSILVGWVRYLGLAVVLFKSQEFK
jgi:hypothetical protein